jgi:hypothetical protein
MTRRPSYAEPELELYPERTDVELPFDDLTGALHNEQLGAASLAEDLERTRRALVDALAYLEAGKAAPGVRVREWRALAGTSYVDNLTPEERRDDGIARAAAKWTDDEVAQVDAAIAAIAARRRATGHPLNNSFEFTTADVWQELGDSFPVTKGIAGRMLAAKGAGLIANTGRTIIAPKDATGPNHGQRLTVWRAL